MTTKSTRPSFTSSTAALLAVPYSVTPGESKNFDLTSSQNLSSGSNSDPAYLFNQLKSTEWLQRYGLKSQKLTFDQILQQIGFKRVESFDPVIGKTVSAKYAGNLYHEVQHDNGDRYVLTCRPDKLREYHHRLTRMVQLLRKRLFFLTNGSRRLFGMIGEPSVCLICDCKTFDHRLFNQFQTALTSLLKEQISKIKRFNIIWVSNDNEQFREQPVDVNSTSIDQAMDWICDRKCPKTQISITSTSEAVLKAFANDVHSIYLISEGDSSNLAREILRDNIVKTRLSMTNPIPFHVISLFCHNSDTQTYLRSIAQSTDGTYFCYKIQNEISDLKSSSNLYDPTRIQLQNDKLQMGTNMIPPEQEYPIDISLMYKEIIQCQSIIDRIEKILGFIRDENQNPVNSFETTKSADGFNVSGENSFQRSLIVQSSALFNAEDSEMSSVEWLKLYGIDAQKLDFFSVLQSAAFRHCDGVIKLLKPPKDSEDLTAETPANPQDKLINARYCDQFAHVAWPDGTIRHVHVTPELYRDYERRIRALLEKIRARLLWLKKGSRDVFGTVIENNIYILIDTSKSMEHHLGFVKEKLRLLIKDQLFAKERLNMIAFNSVINPWRDRLTKINDSMLSTQLQPWIDGLNAEGSTNTLGALRFALADPSTEAIYLLSDGRPDQNERHILSQVQYRQVVPIHTIGFNCQDESANRFLYDLAKQTGGRFHAFQYGLEKQTAIELPESEDVGNLKNELERGQKELERIGALRDECLGRAWAAKTPQKPTQSALLPLKSQTAFDIKTRPSSSTMERRIKKKKSISSKQKPKRRSKSADEHIRLNLDPNQWILPETKEFLNNNTNPTTNNETKPSESKSMPKTPSDEVKSYLKKNSLLAKGLTIFDVLHPTTTTVRNPRHTQVIDRYVLAKVWDDLLSAAYGPYIKRLRLINHYAVDLVKYEEKLNDLIKNYIQFVSNFIWKHLDDEDKRKIGPSLHWNQLSKDEQNQISQEITREEHTSQSSLEEFAWRKLTDDEQTALLENVPAYRDQNEIILKSALKNSQEDSVLKGIKRMDLEIQRARKFLQISTTLRQMQIRADIQTETKTESKSKRPPSSSASRTSRQRFLVCFDDDGFFYPGITKKNRHGREFIQFDMGLEQEILDHTRLPIGGAVPQPHLLENDPVLVRQRNQTREFWIPGLVLILPSSTAQSMPLYTVKIFTPSAHQIDVPRRDLLRISYNLFEQTRRKIERLHNPPIPSIRSNQPSKPSIEPSIRDSLRKELEPLTNKVENLDKNHNRQYKKLQKRLDNHMDKIIDLQNRISQKSTQSETTSVVEISVKTDDPPPPPPSPSPPLIQSSTHSKLSSRKSSSSTLSQSNDFIEINTEVYALCADDDALFYKGTVASKPDELNQYLIKRDDLRNSQNLVSRDDIYLETNVTPLNQLIQKPQTCILIKYPSEFRQCWAPAVILPNSKSSLIDIRFYNCHDEQVLRSTSAIEITKEKFQKYSTLRINFETQLIDQTVVGLHPTDNVYLLGTIIDRTDVGHEYVIRWCNTKQDQDEREDVCKQNEDHIFGAYAWHNQLQPNDCVLALDEQFYVYKPAKIVKLSTDDNQVNIEFLNSQDRKRQAIVDIRTTFVITEKYCRSVIQRLNT